MRHGNMIEKTKPDQLYPFCQVHNWIGHGVLEDPCIVRHAELRDTETIIVQRENGQENVKKENRSVMCTMLLCGTCGMGMRIQVGESLLASKR